MIIKEDINSLLEIPACMINMWDNITDPVGVKDSHSRLHYVNKAYLKLNSLPLNFKVDGHFDHELPTPLAAFAEKLRQVDNLVMETKHRKSALEIHEFGKNKNHSAFVCDKLPLYSTHGDIIGTIFHAKEAEKIPVDIFTDPKQKTGSIMLYSPDDLFSDQEWLIIFMVQKGFKNRQIAKVMNVSELIIHDRISEIYKKSDVNNVIQLSEYMREKKWHNYVPEGFISHGHCAF